MARPLKIALETVPMTKRAIASHRRARSRLAGLEHACRSPLVAEERDRPPRLLVLLAGRVVAHGGVADDLGIRQRLDAVELFATHRFVVAEVEAEPVRRDQRPRLLHVRAEHLAQGPVEDVGGGVVAADGVAARTVDARHRLVALGDGSRLDHAAVQHQARQAVLRVVDAHPGTGRRLDHPGVADLPTGLGIERRAVEHDAHRGAGVGLRQPLPATHQRPHLGPDGLAEGVRWADSSASCR
jgi:hypothetical protein